MRYVDRNKRPARLKEKGEAERNANKDKVANLKTLEMKKDINGEKLKFSFEVYSEPTVKKEIIEKFNEMFHGKCAYCESRYTSIHPVDIEHWRPKALVVTGYSSETKKEKTRPGYPWLAADWDNLLPSCIDCNRERWHKVITADGKTEQVCCGKGNRFPLENDESYWSWEDDPSQCPDKDKPLLLNPCDPRNKPEEHLEFILDFKTQQTLAVMKPKHKYPHKGEKSIEVYALNRSELVIDRRELLFEIMHHVNLIKKLLIIMNSVKKDGRLYLLLDNLLVDEFNRLNEYKQPDKPFTLLVNQVLQYLDLPRFTQNA